MTEIDIIDIDWPARAYIYGTYGFALRETIIRAKNHKQKMYLYRGTLNGEWVWVAAWDPKK